MGNMQTKSFTVSGWQGKRNRQLAKLNKQGWELVQLRLLMGAGVGTALMQRPAAAPAAPFAERAMGSMDSFTARQQSGTDRMKADIARMQAERAAAKLARKTGTKP